MPTLWKLDPSPPACAVRTLGDILGIEFDYIELDFFAKEHKSPEYMKINPVGTIPLLKDGDFILCDSHAIMKYLLEKYGTAEQKESLYPKDLETRAIIDQAMFYDTGVIFVKQSEVVLPAMFEGHPGLTPRLRADIEEAYAVVEAYLGDKPFIAASHLTLADLSLGVTTASMSTAVFELDVAKFPRTVAWLERLNNIPAFKKYTEPGFEIFRQLMKDAWDKNNVK